MSTPASRPDHAPPRRSWLLPAAAAAVLVAAGAWLLAPAATNLFQARQGPPATTTPSGPAHEPTALAPNAPTSTRTSPPATSSSSAPSTPTAAASEPARTDTGQDPPEELWRPVAEGFATDFATPGEDWAQRLAAWTTPELAQAYAYTDPTRQPSAQLVDLETSQEGDVSVRALATYADNGAGDLALDLQVLLTPDGWRVSSASREQPTD